MGMYAKSTFGWGIRLDHAQVTKLIETVKKHFTSQYPNNDEDDLIAEFANKVVPYTFFNWEYDSGCFGGRKELMVFYTGVGGEVDRCEDDGFECMSRTVVVSFRAYSPLYS
jgi:hypothetical protein